MERAPLQVLPNPAPVVSEIEQEPQGSDEVWPGFRRGYMLATVGGHASDQPPSTMSTRVSPFSERIDTVMRPLELDENVTVTLWRPAAAHHGKRTIVKSAHPSGRLISTVPNPRPSMNCSIARSSADRSHRRWRRSLAQARSSTSSPSRLAPGHCLRARSHQERLPGSFPPMPGAGPLLPRESHQGGSTTHHVPFQCCSSSGLDTYVGRLRWSREPAGSMRARSITPLCRLAYPTVALSAPSSNLWHDGSDNIIR